MDKEELRKEIRQSKRKFSDSQLLAKSKSIKDQLLSDASIQNAKCILVYWSLNDEVNTHELISELHPKSKVLLPVVIGSTLELREFTGAENMVKVPPYGIMEPIGEAFLDYDYIDVALVPGMAFDILGNRLGRGKAYYDGFLPKLSCEKIGICFDFQLLVLLETEPHDIKMDRVVNDYYG